MQSRLSTHRPDGSVAEDEDVVVCEVCELLLPAPVFVVVVLSVAVDEGVCSVVVSVVPDVPVVPPVSAPVATDVESVVRDCDCEAVVAVGVGEVAESGWTDDRVVVDAASPVRRCEVTDLEGVFVDACCALAGVDAGSASSEVGNSATPMDRLSGDVAAWVRTLDCWFIAETVRPPPTRATAVATTALRWFFRQRAR